MEILFKHTWILFIGYTFIMGAILKTRSKKYIEKNPDLQKGYDDYLKGLLFYANIPWLIMMIGSISGITQNTFEYAFLKEMNPIVIAFNASIIVLFTISARWIYFKDGAEFLERHPGLLKINGLKGSRHASAKQIKLFFPLLPLTNIISTCILLTQDMPGPIL